MIYVVYETDFWDTFLVRNVEADRYRLRLVTSDAAQAGLASCALLKQRWGGHGVVVRDVREVPPLRRVMSYHDIEALP